MFLVPFSFERKKENVKLEQPMLCLPVNDFIIMSAKIEIPISERVPTTHITFIVNIYNMWREGLELNFIVPTKIQILPNWLRSPALEIWSLVVGLLPVCLTQAQNLNVIRASFGWRGRAPNVNGLHRASPKPNSLTSVRI